MSPIKNAMSDSRQSRMTSTSMSWELVDNHLVVRHHDGSLARPSADEIYSVIVERTPMVSIPSAHHDSVIDCLTFSTLPLCPEIHIESDNHTELSLRISLHAVGSEVSVNLGDSLDDMPDHIVKDYIWYPLVPGSLDELRGLLRGSGITTIGPLSLKNYLSLLWRSMNNSMVKDKSLGITSAQLSKSSTLLALESSFQGTLLPYQRIGTKWLMRMAREGVGGILADDMGLGKTVQIVALFMSRRSTARSPSLVVAPGTLLENWRREICRFAPILQTLVHHGPNRTGFPSTLYNNDVVIVSYDTLVRDTSLFDGIQWDIVVADEAQAIKNPNTKRTYALKRISRVVGVAVTGTPVENRLRDLWSLTDFVLPNLLGDQSTFESKYVDDQESAVALEPIISPILLRRRISDVAADLPDRVDIPQALELDSAGIIAYESLRIEILEKYATHATLAALTRLRQFCAHPWLVTRGNHDPTVESTKYLRLTEILSEVIEAREKVIIFTSFREMIDIMVSDIANRFLVSTAYIDGRTNTAERQHQVDQFSRISSSAVLILNPRAAGTGLNITAANHVIHYNLEWNPAIEDQASARSYRRGQTRPVTVHRLFYANTVEETMDRRLQRKRDLASEVVVGTDGVEDNTSDILAALRRSPMQRSAP